VDGAPVKEIAARDVVTVAPDDSLLTVLERITEEGVDHVPVLDEGRLVGICTQTDLLRARSRYLEHERPQSGWRPQFRRTAREPDRKTA
jgi:chloride channel protein, CIC family